MPSTPQYVSSTPRRPGCPSACPSWPLPWRWACRPPCTPGWGPPHAAAAAQHTPHPPSPGPCAPPSAGVPATRGHGGQHCVEGCSRAAEPASAACAAHLRRLNQGHGVHAGHPNAQAHSRTALSCQSLACPRARPHPAAAQLAVHPRSPQQGAAASGAAAPAAPLHKGTGRWGCVKLGGTADGCRWHKSANRI